MSINSFGHIFRFTTWGESHGVAIGVVIDGCPPQIALSEADIQPFLDKRRPGQSRYTTQRREADQIKILSGLFEGKTTGTPISLMIDNLDQRSKDYSDIAASYRPGHADYSYEAKYGLRDYRGGGRASARETACRVAAGAVARRVLADVQIRGWVHAIGGDAIDSAQFDIDAIDRNDFFCPDAQAAVRWAKRLDEARRARTSLGAVVEVVASGVPAGWGAPIYAKLDAELAQAMMGINAVKAVEIGSGFGAAASDGIGNADQMRPNPDSPRTSKDRDTRFANHPDSPHFLSNNNGGIVGGISTGQPISLRVAFKPTASIPTSLETVTRTGEAATIATKGRHDPCVGIRGVAVVEAMLALVLADHKLLHRAQCG